tara:strand:+ start:244 stop:426 length:183 start_codon:yes stop_codon:yes gene_type:complete
MIKVRINTYEVFVRIKTSRFGSTATSKVWIEAENNFKAKLQAEALYGRGNIISNPVLVKR